jgi:DNA-binding MarR family transcriptional regulator
MTLDGAIEILQFCYPQVYYACHTRHERARSGPSRLSARDAQLLVHLDRTEPTTIGGLARHMDLAASTVSEAIARLLALDYVARSARDARDRRRVGVVLTPKGAAAVRASSVLETPRLRDVLRRLSHSELVEVTRGLGLLAEACRRGCLAKPDDSTPRRRTRA